MQETEPFFYSIYLVYLFNKMVIESHKNVLNLVPRGGGGGEVDLFFEILEIVNHWVRHC